MLQDAAGFQSTPSAVSDARAAYDCDRTVAMFENGTIIAGTGSDVLELTLPGLQTVNVARITHTGVRATERKRGVVTAVWEHQLRDLAARREALAIFTTSGPGIYHRLGYNPSTVAVEVEFDPAHAQLHRRQPESNFTLTLATATDAAAVMRTVFDEHRRTQPGQVSRRDSFWRRWLRDEDPYRPAASLSERFVWLCVDPGRNPRGYLTYRLAYGHPRDQPVSALVVEDLVATCDEARRVMWAHCARFEQAALVRAENVPADEPLTWMIADPRRLLFRRTRDFLWIRPVDVARALSARRYAVSGSLVLELSDPVLPGNSGTFELEGGPDGAVCRRTTRSPGIALEISDLSAVYLGGFTFTSLARAGNIREVSHGAIQRADSMFSCSPAPWTVTDW